MAKVIDNMMKILPFEEHMAKQFTDIMMLPDEEFNQIYENFNEKIEAIIDSEETQKEIISELRRIPSINIDEEINGIKDFIKTIDDEEELSEQKKAFIKNLIEKSTLAVYELALNPREKIEVKIEKLNTNAIIPTYAHPTDAGADIYSTEEIIINGGETKLVGTGLKVAIPAGYEIQLRPRSGISLKTPLRVANSPATIDSSFRGEIKVIITNISTEPYTIKVGDKIAQMLIAPTPMIKFVETEITDETDRGTNGFGSTDKS